MNTTFDKIRDLNLARHILESVIEQVETRGSIGRHGLKEIVDGFIEAEEQRRQMLAEDSNRPTLEERLIEEREKIINFRTDLEKSRLEKSIVGNTPSRTQFQPSHPLEAGATHEK